MYATPGEGVEVGREHGHQGLAFTGLHFGDAALMQHDAADELHPEGLHAQYTPGGLPRGGKGLGQNVVQGLPCLQPPLELVGLRAQLLVAHGGVCRLQLLNGVGDRIYLFQLPIGIGSEELGKQSHSCDPSCRINSEFGMQNSELSASFWR